MTERTFLASCNVCGRAQNWDDEIAAQADSVWHIYREHRDVWISTMGEDRPPQVATPPEGYGERIGPEIRVKQFDPDDRRIAPEVPDRLFSASVLAACERVVAENIAEWGWDVPPILGLIFQTARTPLGDDMPMHGIELQWQNLGSTVELLTSSSKPWHGVVEIAYRTRKMPAQLRGQLLPAGFVAVGLLSEGWMVTSDPADVEDTREKLDAAKNRDLSKHPRRMEVKMLTAVDINGVRYAINHVRDSEEPMSQCGLRQEGGLGMGGNVPDALHYLAEAMQGHTLPEWPEWSERFRFEVPGQ